MRFRCASPVNTLVVYDAATVSAKCGFINPAVGGNTAGGNRIVYDLGRQTLQGFKTQICLKHCNAAQRSLVQITRAPTERGQIAKLPYGRTVLRYSLLFVVE